MDDTSREASLRYHELLRAQTPAERLAQVSALSLAVRDLAVAGIRARHPRADDAEVRVRLIVRLYGREVAARLCSEVPVDAV